MNHDEALSQLPPQTYVSKVELGERRIDFIETMDFCNACGSDIKQLEKALNK